MSILEDFRSRREVLNNVDQRDATGRLLNLLEWLEQQDPIKKIIADLKGVTNLNVIFAHTGPVDKRPKTNTREDVAVTGLHLIEWCRLQNLRFPDLCFSLRLTPGHNTNRVQDYVDVGMSTYVNPFLDFIDDALETAAAQHSPATMAGARFSDLLDDELAETFPVSAAGLKRISNEFLRPETDGSWQNVGNSCRALLIDFASELSDVAGIEKPTETKQADVKAILGHLLQQMSAGRSKETLISLCEGIWNHTQSVLHRPATTKRDAERLLLWVAMLISEFVQLTRAYNAA